MFTGSYGLLIEVARLLHNFGRGVFGMKEPKNRYCLLWVYLEKLSFGVYAVRRKSEVQCPLYLFCVFYSASKLDVEWYRNTRRIQLCNSCISNFIVCVYPILTKPGIAGFVRTYTIIMS